MVNIETKIFKTRLDNGLTVITEPMPHVRAVSFGVFLRLGSRHELPEQNGISHFIEHALFKGTRQRSAAQIAAESDTLGGYLDAFTSKEMVGFHTKVLDEHLPRAFELIADLVTAPAFDPEEIDKERNVILEEIRMVEDTPDDLVFEIFAERIYPAHPMGRAILGTPQTLATFGSEQVRAYYESLYCPDNFVIAAAGNIQHDDLQALSEKYFGALRHSEKTPAESTPDFNSHITLKNKKDLEQAHLVIGIPCPSYTSEDRYVCYLLNSILGGGMSSRLFQAVRENLGLVYTILSATNTHNDCGYLTIYAGTNAQHLGLTIDATMAELHRLKEEAVSAEELQRHKDQAKASLILNLESTSSRMNSLAQQETAFGRFFSPDEILKAVEAVTVQDIQRLAQEMFRQENIAVTILGPIKGFKLERSRLIC